MTTTANPSFHRRKLRRDLRHAREQAHMRQRQVAEAMDWSVSKLIRIETGTVGITTNDLKALLGHYGISDPATVAEFLETVRASKQAPWWSNYNDLVDPPFAQYLGYESSASELFIYHPLVVPGLLQTFDYGKAILERFAPAADIPRLVDLRVQRQQIFEEGDTPKAVFILGEAALRTIVGSPKIMRAQLRQLLSRRADESVEIEIIPFAAGAHPGMIGPFEVMAFDDGENDALSMETPLGLTIIREDQDLVSKYQETFDGLRTIALGGDAAASLIQDVIAGFDQSAHTTAEARP